MDPRNLSMELWKIRVLTSALAGAAFTLLPLSGLGQIATMPQQSYASDMKLQSKRSVIDFLPDGDSSKPSWKQAESVEFDTSASGKSHFPEISTRVASVWTATHIYFLFSCRYDSLNVYQGEDPKVERWQLWDRDVAEVFLNPQPERVNHYYEFEVAPNNQWIDLEIDKNKNPFTNAAWNSGIGKRVLVLIDFEIDPLVIGGNFELIVVVHSLRLWVQENFGHVTIPKLPSLDLRVLSLIDVQRVVATRKEEVDMRSGPDGCYTSGNFREVRLARGAGVEFH